MLQCSSKGCEPAVKRGFRQAIAFDYSDFFGDFKAHSKQGHLHKALQILHKLEEQGYQRCSYTYVCLLQGCIQSNALEDGRLLHDHIVKSEWKPNIFVLTAIVNMYARCGSIEDAQVVFDCMSERNLVTWNMMIAAFCKHEKFEEALNAFWGMQKDGLTPSDASFVCGLKACAGLGSLHQGRKIHGLLKRSKIKPNTLVGNSLVNMFVKCGSMEDAQQIFNNMDERDASSWSVMIAGYSKNGNAEESLRLFSRMQSTGVKPDDVTFLSISNACANLGDLEVAKQIHADIKKSGVKLNILMWNTLIDMYAKCGSLKDAWELFHETPERDISTWNAMIGGLTKHGHCEEALQLHFQMTAEGFHPNQISFVNIINACTTLEDLEHGKQLHSQVAKTGTLLNVFVENALVDMYAKCGILTNARQLFDQMFIRNVVSWNTMIVGCVKHGLNQEVLELFEKMVLEGTKPDEVTYVSLLNACASMTALEQGLQVHNGIVVSKYELDLFVGNALIDMYAKCGRLKDAGKVLDRMSEWDVVSWNTMLAGYAQHGHGQEALQLADRMLHEGVKLNHVSFVGILTACSHAGLVDEGRHYFSFMTRDHGVEQAIEHYGCMVDLLGRSGHLHEAEGLLKRMPLEASAVLWRALLGACRIHGNIDLAIHAAEYILDMEPHDIAVLLLVSNIHASAGEWEDQKMMITMMSYGDQEEDGIRSHDAYVRECNGSENNNGHGPPLYRGTRGLVGQFLLADCWSTTSIAGQPAWLAHDQPNRLVGQPGCPPTRPVLVSQPVGSPRSPRSPRQPQTGPPAHANDGQQLQPATWTAYAGSNLSIPGPADSFSPHTFKREHEDNRYLTLGQAYPHSSPHSHLSKRSRQNSSTMVGKWQRFPFDQVR